MSSLTTLFLVLFFNDLTLSLNYEADATSCWKIQILSAENRRMTCVSFIIAASKHFEKCNDQRAVSNRYRLFLACFSVVSFIEKKRDELKKYSFIVIQSSSSRKMNLNRSWRDSFFSVAFMNAEVIARREVFSNGTLFSTESSSSEISSE